MSGTAFGSGEDTNVRVAVRCRPFSNKEKGNGETSCVKITSDKIILVNPAGNGDDHSFAFDMIIDENSTQVSVWNHIGVPILNKALSGFNGTIFAYGQTGSGKTWSMQGGDGDMQGIIPRMNLTLFEKIESEKQKRPSISFLVTVSYFEIYNEVIFDLLDATDRKKKTQNATKGGLEIKEHPVLGVYVKGLQEIVVDNSSKLQAIIDQGMGSRTVASTQMNADSSRSHSVFMITINQKDVGDESRNIFAKINLVDLAGSERVKSTGATGSTLKEGANINKSLSALGNVINALVEASKGKGTFIPYRNSKLTRVLQESLGGNSVTAMLAALSPAACNFEETLSTLKYANRAKDIKVKAVKNEEASQLNKLNEEIRMLKEKLSGQGPGQYSNVDTSELEDKHRQQLRELEEAMKSTWEAKSKVSEEYERDRQQLLAQQVSAAKQLESAKERNWAILEQKEDLDITLSHIKDHISSKPPSDTSSNSSSSDLSPTLSHWAALLREISSLERSLSEQDTIVQVYRTSLEKDSKSLAKASASQHFDTSSSINMLKQIRDKFAATRAEVQKWTSIQDSLMAKFGELADKISATVTSEQQQQNQEEDKEVSRGLELLQRQSVAKQRKNKESVSETRKHMIDFSSITTDLLQQLRTNDQLISNLLAEDANSSTKGNSSPSKDNTQQQLKKLQEAIAQSIVDLETASRDASDVVSRSITPVVNDSSDKTNSSTGATTAQESAIHEYSTENPQAISSSQGTRAATRDSALISVDGKNVWSASASDASTSAKSGAGRGALTVILNKPQHVTSLEIQGGSVTHTTTTTTSTTTPKSTTPSPIPVMSSSPATVTLQCGLTLTTCDTTIETTSAALGEVIDWSVLLKKNPPEKFLKRPPVRFLFDLVKYIGESNAGYYASNALLREADWEVVGLSKQSKLDFMQEIITFVSEDMQVEPVTTASNIVTGTDPELTNTLLQQLAISIYKFQHKDTSPSASSVGNSESKADMHTPEKKVTTTTTVVSSWVTAVNVWLSLDGSTWTHDQRYEVNLRNERDSFNIKLSSSGAAIQAKFIKVVPLTWASSHNDTADVTAGPALRLNVNTVDKHLNREKELRQQAQQRSVLSSIVVVGADAVLNVLTTLTNTLEVLINTVECVAAREEQSRLRKQEDVKKHLENLTKEKQALSQLLESEKATLLTDKQDLSDQLKSALLQLRETQGLLEKEQEINVQLDRDHKALEIKYNNVRTVELPRQEEENASLQSEILKLQANSIKNMQLIETLQSTVSMHEKTIETLQSDIEYNTQTKVDFEHEKDEFLSNISVLTEELEVTRNHEETLFEQLNERTQDLERLQESYVDISDQYNNSQDEILELRDQLERLQEALANRSMLQKALNTPSQPNNNANNSSNNKQASVPVLAPPKVVELNSLELSSSNSARGHKSTTTLLNNNSHKKLDEKLSRNANLMSSSQPLSPQHNFNVSSPAEEKYPLTPAYSTGNTYAPSPPSTAGNKPVTTKSNGVAQNNTNNTTSSAYNEDFEDYEDEFED